MCLSAYTLSCLLDCLTLCLRLFLLFVLFPSHCLPLCLYRSYLPPLYRSSLSSLSLLSIAPAISSSALKPSPCAYKCAAFTIARQLSVLIVVDSGGTCASPMQSTSFQRSLSLNLSIYSTCKPQAYSLSKLWVIASEQSGLTYIW